MVRGKYLPGYFERMRARVRAAGADGIYVSVMLFHGFSIEGKGNVGGDPWQGHPLNPANHVNGLDGGGSAGVHTLSRTDKKAAIIRSRRIDAASRPAQRPGLPIDQDQPRRDRPREPHEWVKIAGRSRLLQDDVGPAGRPDVGGGSVPRLWSTQRVGARTTTRVHAFFLSGGPPTNS